MLQSRRARPGAVGTSSIALEAMRKSQSWNVAPLTQEFLHQAGWWLVVVLSANDKGWTKVEQSRLGSEKKLEKPRR